MAKPKIVFACQSCGYQSPKWLGRCPDCNQWNTFAEEKFEKAATPRGALSLGSKEDPAPIHEINRVFSGIGEIDRVLAAHYGFTDEELDFIPSTALRTDINYDIKIPDGAEHGDRRRMNSSKHGSGVCV